MRSSREWRRWMNRLRRRAGRRNGVIPCCLLDAPTREIKDVNSKRRYAGDVRRRERQNMQREKDYGYIEGHRD